MRGNRVGLGFFFVWLTLLGLLAAACGSATPEMVVIPTLAVLPSATSTATLMPTETNIPTATPTETPSPTWTPNLVETELEQMKATNAVSQITLAALLTANAVTDTPSLTLTDTIIPSATTPPIVALQPQLIYARSTANLRTCASRTCNQVAQLQSGEAVTANGTIIGEAIDGVHGSWFRVDYRGQALFVYAQLMSITPPAAPTAAPVLVVTSPPVSAPPVASGGCPDVHANCSALTCEQAYACLAAGDTKLDRDKDGIPCESICSS